MRKWTYWHIITWVNPENTDPKCCPGKVGECIGCSRKMNEWSGYDPVNKGFYTTARLKYLGRMLYNFETENPNKAMEILDEWKNMSYHLKNTA